MIRPAMVTGFGVLLSACATASSPDPVTAVITNPGPAVTAEIEAAISAATGRKTRIAQDSLTTTHVLTIDPPFNDRSFAKPDKFILQKRGSVCELLIRQTGQLSRLKTARCAAIES